MRRKLLPTLAACVFVALVAGAASATATTVRVLGRNGRTHVKNDPYLRGADAAALPPAPAAGNQPGLPGFLIVAQHAQAPARTTLAGAAGATTKKHRHRPQVTVESVLAKLERTHHLSTGAYQGYLHTWHSALTEEHHLASGRGAELADVTVLLHNLALAGKLTPARLPVLFLTLERNAQWWRHGVTLAYGARVRFAGSPILWEYYPGFGLQLQVLGNFGEADGLYEAGRRHWPTLEKLLAQLTRLAVKRAGGLAWEYYFDWEGGSPPWVSAMAQATGLIAMTNGYRATGDRAYLRTAHRMLPLLEHAPPGGVAVRTALGLRFLQYSFAPGADIINAFLQTLIGLHDYAHASGDRTARALFQRGNAQAKAELPSFVVTGWSLYEPGEFDDVSYHQLVTGFARSLCRQTGIGVYCRTAKTFERDLTSTPSLAQLTTSGRSGRPIPLRFKLSKLSRVGIVIARKGKDYLYTSAEFLAGRRSFSTPKLHRGRYTVTMSATDMMGHQTTVRGQLRACRHRCPALKTKPKPKPVPNPGPTSGGAGLGSNRA